MPIIYKQDEAGTIREMPMIRVRNEQKDLQDLLESHFELLAGEQVDPENPRRWILIKREMPVQDPNSGLDRWSIDFFFADQDATPTFVECKRHDDSRSRREIVGQLLEYAANGQFYWTKDMIREYAEQSAKRRGTNLEAVVAALDREAGDGEPEDFFDQLQAKLREGQVRLMFFLEEAHGELKSIVDFLNKQMERAEVLLVEARQYSDGKTKLIVPTLYGYTEQARQIKKTITVRNASRRKWDEPSFFERAKISLNERDFQNVQRLYNFAKAHFEIWWGSGSKRGSFSVVAPEVCSRSFISVLTDGEMWVNFEFLQGSQKAERFRDALKREVAEKLQVPVEQESKKFFFLDASKWGSHLDELTAIFTSLVERHKA